jgi:hypothetical protein
MNNPPFDWKPVFFGLGALVVIGVVIALIINFTKGAPAPMVSSSPAPVQAPGGAPAPVPSSPPYTNTQSALADRFWCDGPCIK